MAKYLYPAVFTPEDNGVYSVNFPDVESCYTQGDNLQDAYDMAEDILCLRLYDLEEAQGNIPTPSNPKSIVAGTDSFVVLIGANTLEYRKFYDSKAIKKTLTIPN